MKTPRRRSLAHFLPTVLMAALLAISPLSGCGSGSGAGTTSGSTVGSIVVHPDGNGNFIAVVHRGGNASSVRLVGAFWGRLVDVFDMTDAVNPRFVQFVIGKDLTDNLNFKFDRNAVTGTESLTILHAFGSPGWTTALAQIESGLQTLLVRGLDPMEPPPFTMVARNSALVLNFDDLIDPLTLDSSTVRILTGSPPVDPFESRIFVDRNHGDALDRDGDGVAEFYGTRVVIDFTISEFEKQASPQPLNVNNVGMPESTQRDQANVVIRIPSRENLPVGQFKVLRNLSNHALAFVGNGPTDNVSATQDVVRTFRSGGSNVFPTGPDDFNGFLPDFAPPEILGSQLITVANIVPQGGSAYTVDVDYSTIACAVSPSDGDIIELPNNLAKVVPPLPPAPAPGTGLVTGVNVLLQTGDPSTFNAGGGVYLSAFDPISGDLPDCFIRFSPDATLPPTQGVRPDSSVVVRFSEPMDPASFSAYETLVVNKPAPTSLLEQNVVGQVDNTLDLTEYRFVPTAGMEHVQGSVESYLFGVGGGADGVTDLAGLPLSNILPPVLFQILDTSPSIDSFGVGLRFDSNDQDGLNGPEIRGQFLLDTLEGVIKPRAPVRFSALADASQLTVSAMIPFTMPIATPLSPLGSHLMTVWRYHDLGFSITDESNFNIDVEGLAWVPFSPPSIDSYDEYQILLSHARRLPDEALDSLLMPNFSSSGLINTYANNRLGPQVTVAQRTSGYTINPLNQFLSTSGLTMMPWPINGGFPFDGANLPLDQFTRFTWRNTEVTAVSGGASGGADTARLCQLTGCTAGVPWASGKVPTTGLPLLMEFRCYPDSSAFGLNGVQIALALSTAPRPDFRVYSTGGFDAQGTPQVVDPDSDTMAVGGWNPATGTPTPGQDNSFYYGQADFVVRVSVVHTIWFDTGSTSGASSFFPPIIEPTFSEQPSGTSIVVRFRGASTVTGSLSAAPDATELGPYGNPLPLATSGTVTFFPSSAWTPTISNINGARFVQARIRMVANVDSPVPTIPTLSALGIAAIR